MISSLSSSQFLSIHASNNYTSREIGGRSAFIWIFGVNFVESFKKTQTWNATILVATLALIQCWRGLFPCVWRSARHTICTFVCLYLLSVGSTDVVVRYVKKQPVSLISCTVLTTPLSLSALSFLPIFLFIHFQVSSVNSYRQVDIIHKSLFLNVVEFFIVVQLASINSQQRYFKKFRYLFKLSIK